MVASNEEKEVEINHTPQRKDEEQVVDSIPFEVSQESPEKSTNGGGTDSSVKRGKSSVLSA